jgi:ABC-2 type transport system permease protein
MALRLRGLQALSAALGMTLVILMVGSLFPAVGDSIGKLDVPAGVAELLGGADYGTIEGWMRSEIGAIYGPLVIAVIAIGGAAAIAGEEEDGILGLILAHPVERSRLLLGKAAAAAAGVVIVAAGTLLGLVVGVAVGGGGVGLGALAALSLHLALFGLALGALALAIAAATGRKGLATAGAGGFALLGFLVNGFAPLVDAIGWLKYLSPFYYYEEHNPIANGVDVPDLAALAAATIALTALATIAIRDRDLRR